MAFNHLAELLQTEAEKLDRLRFHFLQTRLLLAANEVRDLNRTTAEVERARQRAREVDLLRAAAVHGLAHTTHRPNPTLRDLAITAPPPWGQMLHDHHQSLGAIVAEIEVLGHRNAALARDRIAALAVRTGPAVIELPRPDDAPTGVSTMVSQEMALVSAESAFQEVLLVATKLRMPSLLAFLR